MNAWQLFHGPNAGYLVELYERYLADPQSVDAATRDLFAGWKPFETPVERVPELDVTRVVGAARLIRYLRELGHLAARIDPLGTDPPGDPGLELVTHGVTQADLAALPAHIIRGPLASKVRDAAEGVEQLRQVYSGPIGYETDQIQVSEERTWIRECAESRRFFVNFDVDRQRELLDRLTEVETFERFLHRTLPGQKRFSLEGCDMLVPVIDAIIRNAAAAGTREVVIGMAHRGRLNVLAHILGKPYSSILGEFHTPDYTKDTYLGWTGDVKYHLGARKAYRESGVSEMPITLAPNPSHLEFVNPVIVGRARAAQEKRTRPGYPFEDEKESLAIVIHGDAAFPGQGIVAETLNMSRLTGYHIGGTIHIILNNQIGFTTDYQDSRSTLYASDLARGFEMPVAHINADVPESCIAVARMAWAYREKFQKDFVIDLVGYRRWGHNEGDEPEFTQPRMYEKIRNHPTVRELWARELERRGVITHEEAQARVEAVTTRLQQAFEMVRERQRLAAAQPAPATPPRPLANPLRTAVYAKPISAQKLLELNEALLDRPEEFLAHPKLERMLQRRRQSIHESGGIEWAHAESLAFAAILADGTPIRMSGQDAERGTFSQRHLVLHDSTTGERFIPLHHINQARAAFGIYNSPLSEASVLAFEYGYSTHAPGTLVLWEAQFGDFANGAQVIIDQFIVAGRSKWAVDPALVLLLPHGHEGQGPEHSSARLERFLQLCATDNLRVAYPSTAAQYFHLLRYQAASLALHPRPLVVMTPKSLLRNPLAAAALGDLAEGHFQTVLGLEAAAPNPDEVTRIVLCSGKVALDLLATGDLPRTPGVDLLRLEMLYPFPADELRSVLARYPQLQEVVWMQEEPENMGAWSYVAPRLRALLDPALPLMYAGRPESASPAEGMHSLHSAEQGRILRQALYGAPVVTPVG